MKVRNTYICEVCGKDFATAKEALECEHNHDAAKRKQDLKEKSEKAISDLFSKHLETFGELPELQLSEAAQKTGLKYIDAWLDELAEILAKELI